MAAPTMPSPIPMRGPDWSVASHGALVADTGTRGAWHHREPIGSRLAAKRLVSTPARWGRCRLAAILLGFLSCVLADNGEDDR